MGKVRKSFQENFKVKPTIGKAAEGNDSLLALNNKVVLAMKLAKVWTSGIKTPKEALRVSNCVADEAKELAFVEARRNSEETGQQLTEADLAKIEQERDKIFGEAMQMANAVLAYAPSEGQSNSIFFALSSQIFTPIKRLCTACALQKGYIKPGCSKIRQGGSPDDFLDFATLYYVERWKKQFEPGDKRRRVNEIQNWLPYIHGTIQFQLIFYNKQVLDYDFLPLPRYYAEDDEDYFDKDLPASAIDTTQLTRVELGVLSNKVVLHTLVTRLPKELRAYTVDILHYLSHSNELISPDTRNYVIIGVAFLRNAIEKWISDEQYMVD